VVRFTPLILLPCDSLLEFNACKMCAIFLRGFPFFVVPSGMLGLSSSFAFVESFEDKQLDVSPPPLCEYSNGYVHRPQSSYARCRLPLLPVAFFPFVHDRVVPFGQLDCGVRLESVLSGNKTVLSGT